MLAGTLERQARGQGSQRSRCYSRALLTRGGGGQNAGDEIKVTTAPQGIVSLHRSCNDKRARYWDDIQITIDFSVLSLVDKFAWPSCKRMHKRLPPRPQSLFSVTHNAFKHEGGRTIRGFIAERQARTNVVCPAAWLQPGRNWNHHCQSSVRFDGHSIENNWRRAPASVFSRHPAAHGLESH
jgi:hypothetical protein